MMEKTVIPDDKTMHYIQDLDEEREEILMDFFVDYMVIENNVSGTSSSWNVDGRLINKAWLRFCFDQSTIIPFNLGADPVYVSRLFFRLEELSSACGFHPGLHFTRSILVNKKRLEELKQKHDQTKKDVEIILKLHFGNELNGLEGLRNYIHNIISMNKKSQKDQFASDVDRKYIGDLIDSVKLDYVHHRINERTQKVNPDTRNIIEEIDSILSNEVRPDYVDKVDLERKIKDAFKNHRKLKFQKRKLGIGKSYHERSLHAVVAKKFPIGNCIREQLEVDEEEVLKARYIRHYELLKEKKRLPEEMSIRLRQFDPIPEYGGLILVTLSIPCRPNIPLTKEHIQSYLKKIEIETLLNWGLPETRRTVKYFENGNFSFGDLFETLSNQWAEGKPLRERLRYLSSKLTELLPAGHMSENTRPLQLKSPFNEKRSCCEGYVLILGFLFHFWQNIFPELLNTDIHIYLFQNEVLNNIVGEDKFREPHMFVTVRINDRIEVIDPTNKISSEMVRRNIGLRELLQEEGYRRLYKIRKIGGMQHDK